MSKRRLLFFTAVAHSAIHAESSVAEWYILYPKRALVFLGIAISNGVFYAFKSSLVYFFVDYFWRGYLDYAQTSFLVGGLSQLSYLGIFLAGLIPGGCKPSYILLLATPSPWLGIACYLVGNTAKIGLVVNILTSSFVWVRLKTAINKFVDWWIVRFQETKRAINRINGK